MPKWLYTLGKWASNLAVLATMVGVMATGAIGMQLLRGEDLRVDLMAIVLPFLIVTMPAMAVIAALAVLFETIPWLRGGLGNVAYFFLWGAIVVGTDVNPAAPSGRIGGVVGFGAVLPSMIHSIEKEFDITVKPGQYSLGLNIKREGDWNLEKFTWDGMTWTGDLLAARGAWVLIALGLATAAALPFDRFDSPGRVAPRRREAEAVHGPETIGTHRDRVRVSSLEPAERSFEFIPLLAAELRLVLAHVPKAWFLVAAGLAVACCFTPMTVARGVILPLAWIWPLLVWSMMGAREAKYQTAALLFSSPRPLVRQLAAVWLAGVIVAVAMGAGVAVRLAFAKDLTGLGAWTAGALFIPSLALAAGVWTGSGKLFEVLYLLLWYVGPMNRIPFLDFVGVSRSSTGSAPAFAIATVVLLALAAIGRGRALRGG
jgi:hypothetical protein